MKQGKLKSISMSLLKSVFSFYILTFLLISSAIGDESKEKKPPNIIVFLADDLGWNDVSFHGSDQIPTPNIDRLAHEGIILNNYYVQPLCSPSRAALLTGRYPIHTGFQSAVVSQGFPFGLPLNFRTLPQHLSKLGYRSHLVGKWHLGFFNKLYTPTYRGFETFFGFYNGAGDYFDHTAFNEVYGPNVWGYDWHHDVNGTLNYLYGDFGKYSTDVFAEKSIEIIKKHNKSQPLFLEVSFQSVHSANPDRLLQAPQKSIYKFNNIWSQNRRIFAGNTYRMDEAVGSVMDQLKESNMLENSIVLFSSDNGGAANGMNDNWASNTPLRGTKRTLWEGGVRAAGAIWGKVFSDRAGTVSTDLIHITDWLPTFYEAAGGHPKDLGDIDGVSAFKLLTGKHKRSSREEILLNIDPLVKAAGIKRGDFKLLYNPSDAPIILGSLNGWYQPTGSLPGTNYTFPDTVKPSQIICGPVPSNIDTRCYSVKSEEKKCLYDVEKDPCEYHNLVDLPEFQSLISELDERILYYKSSMVPFMFPPFDESSNPKYFNNTWKPWRESPIIPPNVINDVLPTELLGY